MTYFESVIIGISTASPVSGIASQTKLFVILSELTIRRISNKKFAFYINL